MLDLTVYAHGALEALQTIVDPQTYGDLGLQVEALAVEGERLRRERAGETVTRPAPMPRRRILSQGIS